VRDYAEAYYVKTAKRRKMGECAATVDGLDLFLGCNSRFIWLDVVNITPRNIQYEAA
jgi:hypothetical protein